jgi:UDP-2,3-diacylglucosamine pyrophosphatase LpxH
MAEADPRKIAEALDRVYATTDKVLPLAVDIDTARFIIFSDQHKGQRDGADDFARCERAYNAALAYYLEKGFTLFTLGDVEELWECRPKNVMEKYSYNLKLEAQFERAGRYYRFYGNHDDDWAHDGSVKDYLHAFYGDSLRVYEGARLAVTRGDAELGTILMVHGHQGTTFSDRHRKLSRFVVRNLWRPIQRLFRISTTTPAKDWVLREAHGKAMHQWAAGKSKVVLIAGHTHRPVMMSRSHTGQLLEELDGAIAQAASSPQSAELRERVASLRAELEWVKAQGPTPPAEVEALAAPVKPCYFNSGCCCYPDGDVTGLEISDGVLKLVRWPNDSGEPKPKVLAGVPLEAVFGAL